MKISDIKVFLHQRDAFWQTTAQSPGILINDATISQVQIKYDDIRTLASDSNDCSNSGQGSILKLQKWKVRMFVYLTFCPRKNLVKN